MTFAQVAAPTLHLLDEARKDWHANLARTLRELVAAEGEAGPTQPSGSGARSASDRSRNLRRVADTFYRGTIARRIDAWSRASGGLIRYVDLATHTTRLEEPVVICYRGYEVYKCGPWTQGPCLLEALQILEGFDLKSMAQGGADRIHVTVEALKLAMADRDTYYADPLFHEVPLQKLLDPKYAAERRALVHLDRASLTRRPGDALAGKAILDPARDPAEHHGVAPSMTAHDTTTCVVVDRWGNMVAATPSGWSGVMAGDTGVWLGSRLQSFNTWPDHPNVIEPGKRPRITLTPTIVLQRGTPILAASVAGGDHQDQMMLQLLLNHLDFHLEPAVSVLAPRFMTDHFIGSFLQKAPSLGKLRINPEFGVEQLEALQLRGHILALQHGALSAAPCVLSRDPALGLIRAAGDPRTNRHALAY
jgi:gamma-glutamyltranspeptidase / glutathione hydrolase